jgi:hypothetical protein
MSPRGADLGVILIAVSLIMILIVMTCGGAVVWG